MEQTDDDLKRCGQHDKGVQCPCAALFRFTWPGRDEAFICAGHVPKLRAVAAAMGLNLQITELTP